MKRWLRCWEVVLKGALAASGECQWGASLDLSMDNPRIE